MKWFINTGLFFFCLSCNRKSCIDKGFYDIYRQSLERNFAENTDTIGRNYYLMERQELFSELCEKLKDEKQIIIIEQVTFSPLVRKGLVYLHKKDLLFNYSKSANTKLNLKEGFSNLLFFEPLLNKLKKDFGNTASSLIERDKKIIVYDGAQLKVIYVDFVAQKAKEINLQYDESLIK